MKIEELIAANYHPDYVEIEPCPHTLPLIKEDKGEDVKMPA